MRTILLEKIQAAFNATGYQIRRIEKGVRHDDAMSEQLRLAEAAAGGPISTIFEVGAANGRDCLTYCERAPQAHVHAFEPLPTNFAKLAEKAETEPRLTAHQMALSDREGEADFIETAGADASSLFRPRTTGATFDRYTRPTGTVHHVRTSTLDAEASRLGVERIDLLKLDVQGAERAVLDGATGLLSRRAIGVIYTEIQFVQIYEGTALYHHIAQQLEGHGYRLHNLYDLVHDQRGALSWGDAIFVREDSATQPPGIEGDSRV